jgi:hypothetical protein
VYVRPYRLHLSQYYVFPYPYYYQNNYLTLFFDIELLLRAQLYQNDDNKEVIKSRAIAVIDSEAESTTIELNPYLTMLKGIAKMYKKYLPFNEASEKVALFLESLDEEGWDRLLENIPKENIGKDVNDFKYDFLTVK